MNKYRNTGFTNEFYRNKAKNDTDDSKFMEFKPPNMYLGKRNYSINENVLNKTDLLGNVLKFLISFSTYTLKREEKEQIKNSDVSMFSGGMFDQTIIRFLCETCTLSTCNTVRKIDYTKMGKRVCNMVCQKQNLLIRSKKPTDVTLAHTYCTKIELKLATCVCVFKVTTKETTTFVFYNFTPNYMGYLNMTILESGLPYQL